MRPSLFAFVLALASLVSVPAFADGFTHVVRPGETLASIAQRYYGDPRKESVLVTENGLTDQEGVAIVVGMRLTIPSVYYHHVAANETWNSIAERYYGDARRAFVIIDANRASPEQPTEGAELVIPYPLRYVASQGDTIARVAESYYGDGAEATRMLRRFNGLTGVRLTRGQVVLVPLPALVLSDEGRQIVARETGASPSGGETRALQESIDAQIPDLLEHVRRGRYLEAVTLGNRLLGAGQLTATQVVTIERELGTALVALGRNELAIQAFRAALQRQPDLELDTVRTSPRVLESFERAQAEEQNARRTNQGTRR